MLRRPLRHRILRNLLLPVLAAASGVVALGTEGCKRTPVTEYVAGFSTQVQVPREFRTLEVSVWVSEDATKAPALVECHYVDVVDGKARLPKTLGVDQGSDNLNMMVSVVGFAETRDTVLLNRSDCNLSPSESSSTAAKPRVLRRSRQNYRDGRILYLPMPLKYACFDISCACGSTPDGETCEPKDALQTETTCAGSRCVTANRNERLFREYSPDLAFGDSSACFSQKRCMTDATVPVLEDAATCTYSIKGSTEGLNVRVVYDGYVTEVLDQDQQLPTDLGDISPEDKAALELDLSIHEEGFTVLPDTTPGEGRFRLAAGLCDLTKSTTTKPHKIVALAASRSCAPKSPSQPLCDEGSEVLIPAPSRLYVLLDRSSPMQVLLNGPQAIDAVLKLSLDDPVFTTTDVAFHWLPGTDTNTCPAASTYQNVDVPFLPAQSARDKIVAAIQSQGTLPIVATASPQNALTADGAYATLASLDSTKLNRRAVVLITNNGVGLACDGSATSAMTTAAAQFAAQGIATYVIELAQQNQVEADRVARVAQAQALAVAGGTLKVFDATTQDTAATAPIEALNTIVADLSSCLYERPGSITDPTNTKLSFIKLAGGSGFQEVSFNSACTAATSTTTDGWNLEANGTFIRICGTSCQAVRDSLQLAGTAAAISSANGSATLPQPVFITATQSFAN